MLLQFSKWRTSLKSGMGSAVTILSGFEIMNNAKSNLQELTPNRLDPGG